MTTTSTRQLTPPRQQGTIGLWWLSAITLSIYYLAWYQRINDELADLLGEERPANGAWWSQLIPIYNCVGLYATAVRVNRAIALVGTNQKPVGTIQIWLWRPDGRFYMRQAAAAGAVCSWVRRCRVVRQISRMRCRLRHRMISDLVLPSAVRRVT